MMSLRLLDPKMSIVKEIISLFGESTKLDVIENFDLFESNYELHNHSIKEGLTDNLTNLLSFFNVKKVNLTLTFDVQNQNPIRILASDLNSVPKKLKELNEQYDLVDEDEKVQLEIRVDKNTTKTLDTFDFSSFSKYLNSLTLQESLDSWSKFEYFKVLNVNIWEDIKSFATHSIVFNSIFPSDNSIKKTIGICVKERADRIEKRDKCGHFANAAQFNFVPQDFKLCTSNIDNQLNSYFSGIFNSLLIIYLSDFSSITGDILKYRLKGYKLLSENIEFSKLKPYNLEELNKIYEWTYLEGNYTDKI
jgi:hypothetical protein